MARDQKRPMKFILPDDKVSLITWEYVVNKLGIELSEAISSMNSINEHLQIIDDSLSRINEGNTNNGGGNSGSVPPTFDDSKYVKEGDNLIFKCDK